jgi:hypothetical protein
MSKRVLMLVEGPTERGIIQQVLAPYLGDRGVYLSPKVVGKPGHKGGVRGFDPVARELRALALQERESTITMLFDYYALPIEWPGVQKSKGRPAEQIPGIVEPELHQAMMKKIGDACDPRRFIPYVQMHEIEAWFFAGPDKMAAVFEQPNLEASFRQIVAECGGCEKINDHPETAPSKRIEKLSGRYKKGDGQRAHAPVIVSKIGIDDIRNACPHFNEWLTRLEALAT